MGDADSEIIVPVQEIQTWMDEALEVVDEGLDHLFLYMINVNDRTKQILQKLKSLDSFKQWFFALNLLIVPVVMSILICFSTRNTIDSEGLEEGLQLTVAFLMFLSGSIGLPLYFYSMWQSYLCAEKLKAELSNIRQCVPRTETGQLDSAFLSEDSFLTFASNETSLERLNDFARLLTDRMPGGMRTNIERRLSVQFPETNEGDYGNEMEPLSVTTNLCNEPGLEVSSGNEISNDRKEDIQDFTANTQENNSTNEPDIFESTPEPDLKQIEDFLNEPAKIISQSEEINALDTRTKDFDLQINQHIANLISPSLLSEFEKQLDDAQLFCHYKGDTVNSEDYY